MQVEAEAGRACQLSVLLCQRDVSEESNAGRIQRRDSSAGLSRPQNDKLALLRAPAGMPEADRDRDLSGVPRPACPAVLKALRGLRAIRHGGASPPWHSGLGGYRRKGFSVRRNQFYFAPSGTSTMILPLPVLSLLSVTEKTKTCSPGFRTPVV